MDKFEPTKSYDITPALENKADLKTGKQIADTQSIDAGQVVAYDGSKPSPTGKDADPVDIAQIVGFFEVVSTVPTAVPSRLFEQIKIYKNGGTIRLYIYDYKNHAWRYSALT